jgi:hypothetical protein
MKCEQIAELLPDYLQGGLNPEQDDALEQHMEQCADCREELAIWKKLALLPIEQPGTDSRARFEAMLEAYQTGRSGRAADASSGREQGSRWSIFQWLRSPVAGLAWSLALLAIGVFAGNYINGYRARSQELTSMQSELTNMRQMVVLSMLQQQSASERLQGVTWSRRDDQLDPQIMSALLHTLRYDGSVDVRLAALDALSRHASQPQVHKGVTDALQEQQSPLVQVALIDLLMEWRDPDLPERLHNLQQSPNLNPTVRQRTEWALNNLN